MRIEEVEEILNALRLLGLLAPQHIFITDEPIYEELDGQIFFRGLSPKDKRGVMILSKHADITTVPHELIHAALGLGELAAYPLGRLLAIRYKIADLFPSLKQLKLYKVKYREAEVPPKYMGRVKHYVREK